MPAARSILLLLACVLLAGTLSACSPRAVTPDTLRIVAAASLVDILQAAAVDLRPANLDVRCQFAASSASRRQIEAGARGDVFISADPRDMDVLERGRLLLEGSRRDLYRNRLVLIQPSSARVTLHAISDLGSIPLKRVAIGEPGSVPAGRYARQALERLGLWSPLTGHVVQGTNVRIILDWAVRGEVDAAIVYATDARAARERVRLVAVFPESSHDAIVYPGAALASSRHPREALAFLDALASPPGRLLARRFGFDLASEQPAPSATP